MNRLEKALDFDAEELTANRAGKFSARQIERLQQAQAHSVPILWGMSVFVVVMLALGLLVGGIALAVFGMIALIGSVMALLEYVLSYQGYRQDFQQEVASIQGQLHFLQPKDAIFSLIDRVPDGIRVGDVSFLLLEHQVKAFHEGDIYSLYYAPRTNSLLSAEKIMSYEDVDDFENLEFYEDKSANQLEIRNL